MPWWGSKQPVDTHSGTVGDLSEDQEKVLEEFKLRIKKENITTDPRFDDYYLLKFCRARKFDLEKTVEMFTNFINWRTEHKVDQAMALFKWPNMPDVKKIYQHGYHSTDREGRPFYIDRPWMVLIDEVFKIAPKQEIIHYFIREYEKYIHMRAPSWSAAAGVKIEKSFSVMDIKGFSTSHFSSTAREFLKIPMGITRDFYPETMHKLMIVNAPFLFKGVWSVMKPFIDEKTRQKISILGSSFQTELFECVDPDNVPKILGGNCTWEEYVDTSKVDPDEHGTYWFSADRGPWNTYPGDEFWEEAKKKVIEVDPIDEPLLSLYSKPIELDEEVKLVEPAKKIDSKKSSTKPNLKICIQAHQKLSRNIGLPNGDEVSVRSEEDSKLMVLNITDF